MGAPKMRNIFLYFIKVFIFKKFPAKIFALKLVASFFVSVLYVGSLLLFCIAPHMNSYHSSKCNNCRPFSLLNAIAITNEFCLLFAIAFRSLKERQLQRNIGKNNICLSKKKYFAFLDGPILFSSTLIGCLFIHFILYSVHLDIFYFLGLLWLSKLEDLTTGHHINPLVGIQNNRGLSGYLTLALKESSPTFQTDL